MISCYLLLPHWLLPGQDTGQDEGSRTSVYIWTQSWRRSWAGGGGCIMHPPAIYKWLLGSDCIMIAALIGPMSNLRTQQINDAAIIPFVTPVDTAEWWHVNCVNCKHGHLTWGFSNNDNNVDVSSPVFCMQILLGCMTQFSSISMTTWTYSFVYHIAKSVDKDQEFEVK